MSDNNNASSSGGIGVAGALGILFVALKLLDKIDWPWLLVLAPFWGPLALVIAILLIIAVVAGGLALGKKVTRVVRKKRQG